MKWSELKDLELRNLSLKESAIWPVPVKIIFCGLIVAFTILVGYFLVIREEISTLHQAERQETSLKQVFKTKALLAAALPAYQIQFKKMQQLYGVMLHQLPSRDEIPSLLRDISTTAQLDGLKQRLFKPVGAIRKHFYVEQPIVMEYVGTYHQLGKFVSDVGALPRIVTLSQFSIEPLAHAPNLLLMRVIGFTYRYFEKTSRGFVRQPGGHP
jgi:type IV pilus assembly protein PilO